MFYKIKIIFLLINLKNAHLIIKMLKVILINFFLLTSKLNISINENFIDFDNCICSDNKSNCLSEEPEQDYLKGKFDFDYENKNDLFQNFEINPEIIYGPGFNNSYGSLKFDKTSLYKIKKKKEIDLNFSLSFWVFLKNESLDWTTILYLNENNNKLFSLKISKIGEMKLSYLKEKRITSIFSNGSLTNKRWNNIILIFQKTSLKLYLNGFLDIKNENTFFDNMKSFPIINLGRDEVHNSFEGFLDNFSIYQNKINLDYIFFDNNLYDFFFGINDFYFLGHEFFYEEAASKCKELFHLCTLQEIYSQVFQMARINGWLRKNQQLWYYISDLNIIGDIKEKRGAVCCKNKS